MPPDRQIRTRNQAPDLIARQRTRERQKLLGLLLVVLFVLVLLFARFGKTIPWGAR